jgi:ankyrin repeat protein
MPLHVAAQENSGNMAELLLAKGADVNAEDRNGWTPLHYAIVDHRDYVATLLRAHGGKDPLPDWRA